MFYLWRSQAEPLKALRGVAAILLTEILVIDASLIGSGLFACWQM